LEELICSNSNAVSSSDLSRYRLYVSKYCYAVTYRNRHKENDQTINIRISAADTLYALATERMLAIHDQFHRKPATQRQPQNENKQTICNHQNDIQSRSIFSLQPAILRAFHALASSTVSDSFSDHLSTHSLYDSTSGVMKYRQSLPDLVKLSLELNYELLTILQKQLQLKSHWQEQLSGRNYHLKIVQLKDRMTFQLELLLQMVHESFVALVEDMKMDFLLTCGGLIL